MPSQADVAVFEAVSGPPPADLCHALRWYNHIKSYEKEKARLNNFLICLKSRLPPKLKLRILTRQNWVQATLVLLGYCTLNFCVTLEGPETEVLHFFTEQVEHGQQQFSFFPHCPANVPGP